MMSMRSSLSRLLASTSARKSIVNRVSRCNGVSAIVRTLSSDESITYSGGQATEGQGGFYGSGGARVISADDSSTVDSEGRSVVLALAADVQKISQVMKEFERLENLLISEENDSNGTVTGKSIELKSSIKKLMTSPDVLESLNRLEIQGEPVWGLSTEERDLVILARETVNEC